MIGGRQMEVLSVLVPFFLLGVVATILSKFTGITLSMFLAPAILYFGATPEETVIFMLTFTLYTAFTMQTQDVRLDVKHFTFFKGWWAILPVVVTLGIAFWLPILGIGLFIFYFVMELLAAMYQRIDKAHRPSPKAVGWTSFLASVTCLVGLSLVRFIPAHFYFLGVGLAILILTAFAYYAGKHRSAFRASWGYLWGLTGFLLGLFGIEGSDWVRGLIRSYRSPIDAMIPVAVIMASFLGTMYSFALYGNFSVPAFAAAIGAAIGIRFVGLPSYDKSGPFSILTIGFAILAVFLLYLVSPVPTGFEHINQLFNQQI